MPVEWHGTAAIHFLDDIYFVIPMTYILSPIDDLWFLLWASNRRTNLMPKPLRRRIPPLQYYFVEHTVLSKALPRY